VRLWLLDLAGGGGAVDQRAAPVISGCISAIDWSSRRMTVALSTVRPAWISASASAMACRRWDREDVWDFMEGWFAARACDGFNLIPP